jgi:hypothetical protein
MRDFSPAPHLEPVRRSAILLEQSIELPLITLASVVFWYVVAS